MNQPVLIIIRGLPGSGKSTLAQMIAQQLNTPCHYESDMYHIDDDGVYRFRPEKIKASHEWCQKMVEQSLSGEASTVIVSNTFTQMWEMLPYLKMAKKRDIPVQVIECKGNFGSIHNVPESTIKKMSRRWEKYNPAWFLD